MLVDSINYCIENRGLVVYAWCRMTNHVHMIIATEDMKLQDIMRDLKGHSSKEIINAIKENQQESRREWMFWMFKRAGRKNGNNKNNQFWPTHNNVLAPFSLIEKMDFFTFD